MVYDTELLWHGLQNKKEIISSLQRPQKYSKGGEDITYPIEKLICPRCGEKGFGFYPQ